MTLEILQAGCRIANRQQILKAIPREGDLVIRQTWLACSFADQAEFDDFTRTHMLESEPDPGGGMRVWRAEPTRECREAWATLVANAVPIV